MGGRTPVILPPPLAILGEPFPTTYVVDSSIWPIIGQKEDLEASLLPGDRGRPGRSRLLCCYQRESPRVLTVSLVGVRTPVCVSGWGGVGGLRVTRADTISISPPWGVVSSSPHGEVNPLRSGSSFWANPANSSLLGRVCSTPLVSERLRFGHTAAGGDWPFMPGSTPTTMKEGRVPRP